MSSNEDLKALGQTTSECDAITDEAEKKTCKDKEDAAAAAKATEEAKENEGKPQKFVPPRSSSDNMDCSMDGFN
tara:strand:+ start:132 stop:353 length:222 start_codon:yes stop_codon:yes gene_type:complete